MITSSQKAVIIALIIVIILIISLSVQIDADADGCVPNLVPAAADHAGQAIRYGWSGQTQAIVGARNVAQELGAPAWMKRRLRLAQIYHARGLDELVMRHLFFVAHHQCW